MSATPTVLLCPEEPFRGLGPYRLSDQAIFFERDTDVRKLIQLTTIYRASLLYGESGAGKSSLINAGLIPRVLEDKMTVERIRIQPHTGTEFIIERIECSPDGDVLPSRLASSGNLRESLSAESLLAKIRSLQGSTVPLLIFDQFEELLTLTSEVADRGGADTLQTQNHIVDTLVTLIRDPKNLARLLFVFREDYLAKFDRLFYLCPELPDRFLRLTPPTAESLPTILRGPFETDRLSPGCWKKEIGKELAARVQEQLRPPPGRASINLAQVQIVAVQLWRSKDPDETLSRRGVDGLVEDYLEGALAGLGQDRRVAESLLTFMITRQGTRKVVLETDAVDQALAEEGIPADTARNVLNRLVTETKLVRRDFFRNAISYEIVNEFLVPWIKTLKLQRAARHVRTVWLRRAVIVVLVSAVILGAILFWRWNATTVEAQKQGLIKTYDQQLARLNQDLKATQDRANETLKLLSSSDDDRVKNLAMQVTELEKVTGASSKEIAAKTMELARAQESVSQLQMQLKNASDRAISLNSEIDKLRKDYGDANARVSELEKLKKDNNDAISRATALTVEIEKLKTDNQGLRDQIEALKRPIGQSRPATNALAIGISRFQSPQIPPLSDAAEDAKLFADFLSTPRGGSASSQRLLLVDANATRAAIYGALRQLAIDGYPNGTAVLMVSGRVMTSSGENWLLTYDAHAEAPEATGISVTEFLAALRNVKAEKIIGFFDFCRSGGTTSFSSTTSRKDAGVLNLNGLVQNQLASTFFFTGGCANPPTQGRAGSSAPGTFMSFVTKGLNGNADKDSDGSITRGELVEYVRSQMTRSFGAQRSGAADLLTESGNLPRDAVLIETRKSAPPAQERR